MGLRALLVMRLVIAAAMAGLAMAEGLIEALLVSKAATVMVGLVEMAVSLMETLLVMKAAVATAGLVLVETVAFRQIVANFRGSSPKGLGSNHES